MRGYHEHRNYISSFSCSAFRVDNFNFLAHWHPDIELVYVQEGRLRMGINSESRVLERGDIAVCGSGDIHYYDSMGEESSLILVIFNPRLIGSPGGWPVDLEFTSNFVTRANEGKEESALIRARAAQLMKELLTEVERREKNYEMFITAKLYELCGLMMRYWTEDAATGRSSARRLGNNRIMQDVLDFLDANYTREVKLEDGAKLARMSTFHFSRYFKSATGMSYIVYLNQLRVRHAEQLVLQTDRKMIDIALDAGFTNIRTFNRVFKQVKGIKPSDLR